MSEQDDVEDTGEVEAEAPPARRRSWLRRSLAAVLTILMIPVAVVLVMVPVYSMVDPVSVPMMLRYLNGHEVERVWRDLDQTSDRLKAAVIMSEDGQFCRHQGIDLGALRAEALAFLAGEEARGASTLTMQVARNLFLWNDRSVIRKALEIPIAIYMDLVLPKRRIMEIYLNIAQWGPVGQFGAEAGTIHAFGQTAEALTWRRATLIAVMLPNPRLRNPANPSPGLLRIAEVVESRAKRAAPWIACLYEDGDGPELD